MHWINWGPPWLSDPDKSLSFSLIQKLPESRFLYVEHYSNFCTFKIASLPNVPGHYLWKYGIPIPLRGHFNSERG